MKKNYIGFKDMWNKDIGVSHSQTSNLTETPNFLIKKKSRGNIPLCCILRSSLPPLVSALCAPRQARLWSLVISSVMNPRCPQLFPRVFSSLQLFHALTDGKFLNVLCYFRFSCVYICCLFCHCLSKPSCLSPTYFLFDEVFSYYPVIF